MRITDILEKKHPIFSFEFFPPKTSGEVTQLYQTLMDVKGLQPGFISVTYGAGGGTRDRTLEIVKYAKQEIGLESAAHLTCVGHSKAELKNILDDLVRSRIDNVVALRGDPPKGEARFIPNPDGFTYASQLTNFIRTSYPFCIAVAGYPEGHIESPDKEIDWNNLQHKVTSGGDIIITNLFFDNKYFYEFEKGMRYRGIRVPIIPGIMPITNYGQILRFTRICGATIPERLLRELERIEKDSEAVHKYGVAHATEQCRDLLRHGVPGIHFYTLNKSRATREIIRALRVESN